MKKSLLILLAVILLFTGCANAEGTNTESTNTESTQNTENTQNSETVENTEEDTQASEIPSEEEETYTFTDLNQVMYASADVNVRDLPSTDGNRIGGLAKAQEVRVTGQCKETNWYRIEYNGAEAYVSNAYINKEKPSSWVKDLQASQTTTQMIVVVADSKDLTRATVSMHTKDANGVWKEEFSVAGRLGRKGIGKQIAGDEKTPVGIYRFTVAFGILSDPGINCMPYTQVDESHHWVGDSNSKYYNQFVSTNDVPVEWASSEHLYKYVPSYHYSLALDYNKECVPGLGSAIFLHCPNYSFTATAGCVAIPEVNMAQAMRLLRSDCIIIIDSEENIWSY